MEKAGAETLYDLTSHAAMLTGALGIIGKAMAASRAAQRSWDEERPALALLLDSPELNLHLARKAHARGIPILYYIAPQTWASRAGRNRKIARIVDKLACILPFEEEYFRGAGVNAEYVGHPLFETLRREKADEDTIDRLRAGERQLVALLPGSREHVIEAVLPLQLNVLKKMREGGADVRGAVSAVTPERGEQIRRIVNASGVEAEIVVEDNASLLTAADLVLVASGTATLHVAHYRKPMIVMYEAGRAVRWLYPLAGRFIVKTPHFSLVNILGKRRIVPEFMPYVRDVGETADVARRLLVDEGWRRLMVEQMDEILRPLEESNASANVCRLMREMAKD